MVKFQTKIYETTKRPNYTQKIKSNLKTVKIKSVKKKKNKTSKQNKTHWTEKSKLGGNNRTTQSND